MSQGMCCVFRTLFAGRNHLFLLILLVLACVKVGGDGVAPPTECVLHQVFVKKPN